MVSDVPSEATAGTKGASGFLLIGSVIIIGGHLLFGLIIGEFTYSTVYVVLAIWLLISLLAKGDWGLTGVRSQKVIGFSLGFAGILLLASDLRFGFPDGVVDNIANLAFYAGGLLTFLGARGLKG